MNETVESVLDTARLETLVDEIGDRDLVRQAVQAFLDEVPMRLHAIRTSVADGDHDEINSSAHALGSPAAMLGALAVRRTTKALQAAAVEQATAEYADLLAAVESSTVDTEVAMRAYLGSPASA
jgi:HPt (histidine-containing phosphotransfer) domain-containing protein